MKSERISGWGRIFVPGHEVRSENLPDLTRNAILTRGLGRSYGDSSLPPPSATEVAGSVLADRMLSWKDGRLSAEAGLSLGTLNQTFLPHNFSSPIHTGTHFVTLGGMVAADVHGKNHHSNGSFGKHVRRLLMRVGDGSIVECSREKNEDLFLATIGGMGLTGHILEVDVDLMKVPSPWIWQESRRIADLEQFLIALKEAGPRWPYTVGWIDLLAKGRGLGRGILFCGRWAEANEAPATLPHKKERLAVPFVFPDFVLSSLSMRLFNTAVYHHHFRARTEGVVHPETYFHPLDMIRHWNRIYGRRGFTQYQCVIPESAGLSGVRKFLEFLVASQNPSFLSVIKECGAEGDGLLSFPKPGITIALDIPVREGTQALVDRLNEILIGLGGRIYLAKDAFTRAEHFRAMEPRLEAWQAIRQKWDPEGRFRSAQSVRIFGDRA